jgi:uncharacterized membrane protein YbhN (UPF0104 family)
MEPAPRRRRRRTAVRVALVALLVAAMVYALAGIIPGSGGRLAGLATGWAAVAVVAELVAIVAYAELFHAVFGPDQPAVGFVRGAQIGIGELGAFAVVPTGAGGPILRVWALLASKVSLPVVFVRSVVHAVALNLPYVLVALVLGLGVVAGVGPGNAPTLAALAPLGVIVATCAVAVAAARYARAHRGEEHGGRFSRIGLELVAAIPEGLRATPRRLRDPRLICSAIAYWAGDCGVLVLAVHAVHGSAPVTVIVLAYLLGQLGNALPLPGGVGGVEPLMLGVFTASGVDSGVAAAAIVVYRFVSLGLQAVLGSLAVASLAPVLDAGARTAAEQLR